MVTSQEYFFNLSIPVQTKLEAHDSVVIGVWPVTQRLLVETSRSDQLMLCFDVESTCDGLVSHWEGGGGQ